MGGGGWRWGGGDIMAFVINILIAALHVPNTEAHFYEENLFQILTFYQLSR